jgi:hypothetical protein
MRGTATLRLSGTGRRPRRHTAVILLASLAVAGVLLALPASAGAVKNAAEFYARGPSGMPVVSCAIYDGYAGSTEALCEYLSKSSQSKATVSASGSVTLCRTHSITSNRCELGNAGEGSPTYGIGKTVTVGRFACTVQAAGVRCIVTSTGQGFLLGRRQLRAVGGATVRRL